MLNFYLTNNPLTTCDKMKLNGYLFSGKLAFKKNWSKIEVDANDCKVEFIKQVFPIFDIPVKIFSF